MPTCSTSRLTIFDVAMSHSSLMHYRGVAEMVRLTRSGGLVIACESN